MILTVISSFAADLFSVGPVSASVRAARALKLLSRKDDVEFLLTSPSISAHKRSVAKHDAFFPITHRSYLCQYFNDNQRILAARQSYKFIDSQFNSSDLAEMAATGKPLWKHASGERTFEIRLMLGNHNMSEGSLSTAFFIDNRHVGVMSFSIVDGSLLGLPAGPCLLLCRNQTTSDRWYQKPLQETFKHIALPYMMIAAVAGVAEAAGFGEIFAVTEDGHPHGEPKYIGLMRGSYSGFWEKYGATPFVDGIVRMALPLESTPLEQVSANHRRRAKGRREVMAQISASTSANFKALTANPGAKAEAKSGFPVMPAAALAALAISLSDVVLVSTGKATAYIAEPLVTTWLS